MMKTTHNTTLIVEDEYIKNGNELDIHHEVSLDVDSPGVNIWTIMDSQGENVQGELVWCDLNDVVDNLLEYDGFEEYLIDDWILVLQEQLEKLEKYKLTLRETSDD